MKESETVVAAPTASPPPPPRQRRRGDYGYTRDYMRWRIRRQLTQHNVPAGSIALVDGDELVWTEGFGMANVSAGIAATADTRFRAGSISQPSTATAKSAAILDLHKNLKQSKLAVRVSAADTRRWARSRGRAET